ncbi:hypothetical protein ALP58_102404 [Pseudomonas savastanoi]|uniref:Uncharacterized protein n=1 Tax=Pseudomonas savastanoi TaxID=29438 RepID=A0A3M5G783_PSESS|nr:hypothetical protein ALP58_102404 [Pseudomonas savastanoi]
MPMVSTCDSNCAAKARSWSGDIWSRLSEEVMPWILPEQTVGEQISTVRLRRTEHRYHPGQCGLGTGAHVHRLGGEPDGVDANHRRRSRRKVAQAAAFSVGQFTLTVPRGCCISTQMFDDDGWDFVPASDTGNGINAGCSAVLFCDCSRIHLWTRFALRP